LSAPSQVVISIPARELLRASIPGSVFDAESLAAAAIAPELKVAIDLIAKSWPGRSGPLQCVARPEIFTHGSTLAWLQSRIEGATDHVCLSDGTSLKLIPGLRNHVFPYGLHSHRRLLEFRKLLLRAPELIRQFSSQVNAFRPLVAGGASIDPPSTLLFQGTPQPPSPTLWFHGFYLNRHSSEDSAERMLDWGTTEPPDFSSFRSLFYVPLTDSSVRDRSFQRLLAETIARKYFERQTCLLVRVPIPEEGVSEATERMITALDGIRQSGVRIPQVQSRSVFFVTGELPEDVLAANASRLSILAHETFEYWRYTPELYRAAECVTFFPDDKRPGAPSTWEPQARAAFGADSNMLIVPREMNPAFQFDE